ncbi:MAG TPA: transglutaminase family protein [Phototrophicaceae bacterium]|nr:transglutaminase family protein [Phototrophicaceae bacterium]
MYYSIQHITRFIYSTQISESLMEVRMKPRTEGVQRCLSFKLSVNPNSRIREHRDYSGNAIHSFDIPGQHRQLALTASAIVERATLPDLPDALPISAWETLDHQIDEGDFWDTLIAGQFTEPTLLLEQLANEINAAQRRNDPLTMLRQINETIYQAFDYDQETTNVDSVIDSALKARKGVCQDFAHIMITLVRGLRIPCRYVSGYLFHRDNGYDRSVVDATHAWVEAYLPDLGWVGFDPTNNTLAGERHIRVAIGRDYADALPTKGVFKGKAETDLRVSVKVEQIDAPPLEEIDYTPMPELLEIEKTDVEKEADQLLLIQQQQQQQQ